MSVDNSLARLAISTFLGSEHAIIACFDQDLFLDDLAIEAGLKRYALYPVQAQHIGLDSARMTLEKEAQAIWSMAYEDLNPLALRRLLLAYHLRTKIQLCQRPPYPVPAQIAWIR